ncbi:hypothetical protein NKDENANG_03756 [Candidatus Entotheonellaceae bacterium PAL068K]
MAVTIVSPSSGLTHVRPRICYPLRVLAPLSATLRTAPPAPAGGVPMRPKLWHGMNSPTLAQRLQACRYRLSTRGLLVLVYHPSRLAELCARLMQVHLRPHRLHLVHSTASASASLVLVEAVRDGRDALTVLPPLTVYNAAGDCITEMRAIFQIDMFGQRFAKALAVAVSLIITTLFKDFSSLRGLSVFTAGIIVVWIFAARYAEKCFRTLTDDTD